MAKKVTLAELKKMAKALNKLDLTDEPVETDTDDIEELAEDFMNAMEEIDDDEKTDECDKKIIKFYVRVMEQFDDDGKSDDGAGDDLREELEDMELKEIKAYIKENDIDVETKVTKKNLSKVIDEIIDLQSGSGSGGSGGGDDFDRDELEEELSDMTAKEMKAYIADNGLEIETKVIKKNLEDVVEEVLDAMEEKAEGGGGDDGAGDEFDRDALEEELSDMTYAKVKKFVKENELEDIDMPKKKDWEDESEDTIEEILDAMEEKAEEAAPKKDAKKDKKSGKKGGKKSGKKGKKSKDADLPKGMRKDSLPAKIYEGLKEDEMSIMDIAELIGKEKKKDADKCVNLALRTIAKSVAKACSVNVRFSKSSDLADGVASLSND